MNRPMRARHSSSCLKCGASVKPGMSIERASFKVREATRKAYVARDATAYVHELCGREARAEWPELNQPRGSR